MRIWQGKENNRKVSLSIVLLLFILAAWSIKKIEERAAQGNILLVQSKISSLHLVEKDNTLKPGVIQLICGVRSLVWSWCGQGSSLATVASQAGLRSQSVNLLVRS